MVGTGVEHPGANPNTRVNGFTGTGQTLTREDRQTEYEGTFDCQFTFASGYDFGYAEGNEQGK